MLSEEMNTAPADVLILPMTNDLGPAIELATSLRQSEIRAQVYSEQKKFKQKMSYADKLGVPYTILLGEDEISQGKVSLKDMVSGGQKLLSKGEAIAEIVKMQGADDALTPILDREE